MKCAALLALAFVAACATPTSRARWGMLEGCWIDGSDMPPPASMRWRRDASRPGALLGEWRVEIQGDVDAVDFELGPGEDGMRVCISSRGAAATCTPAVFGRASEADAARHAYVFYADAHNIEFGSTDGVAPFFWGRRGACTN